MSSRVAAIIPTLDEAGSIAEVIAAAFSAGASEVIVSDGSSSDATRAIAATAGARVLESERVRGCQLNAGAKAATCCDVLIFLHGDTLLPAGACRAAAEALERGALFGGFRISFLESSWRLRLVAAMINARCALTRAPWGDQAQFISREEFEKCGGYRDWPIMEDYELAERMAATGRSVILRPAVRTSGRRFIRMGIIRTVLTNRRVLAAYRRGVPPAEIAAIYRR